MTNPITPPPELLRELSSQFHNGETLEATWAIAFQAGADQELAACCEWTQGYAECGDSLRAARRPKPPSLKEQALARLALLEKLVADLESTGLVPFHDKDDTIRRALEALPE